MPPRDDINRIIIGLGGQGSRVVNEVRKAVEALGPLPAGLDFVAIDSDRAALSNLDSVPESQRIHLAAPDDHLTESVVPWLPHEFRPKAGGGCGMQRLTGKAMYLVHRPRVMEVVREVARKLRQRTQVADFMVVLVNAFGGGTGSGMAIDFALDVRSELKETTGQEPVMFGIGVLPSRSETLQRANGVALLKELHFLLSHKEPLLVGGRDHSSPFELYFLVGREVMGIERDDEILDSIVRFTLDLGLIPSSSRDHSASNKGAGWVDLQDIRTLVKGAGHMFSTFGHYRARFPQKELVAWFDALDEAEALRKELPTLVTDLEAHRRSLEDKRVALEHDEATLATARERASLLRAQGVLGANRPELARFLGELSRAEESVRKRRRELRKLDVDASTHAKRRAQIEQRLRELDVLAASLRSTLQSPVQSRTCYTVPLTEAEIDRLGGERHLVKEGTFASLMQALGRLGDYHDKTMEVVGKSRILYLPLVNYRLAFQTAAAFPPGVLEALRAHGFVRTDPSGKPVVSDDQLWMVMAMLSSDPSNIDATKVSSRAFKETVEGHVARRAEVKIVPARQKPFEVVIHSWMVGVQVAPTAPGYPPRLKELEWLLPEYEQVAREGGLAQHHAFLYGDPAAFTRLANVPVDRAGFARANELVTQFWASYAPIDAQARWAQLPPLVAESQVVAKEVAETATLLASSLDDMRASGAAAPLDRLGEALARAQQGLDAFQRAFAEDAEPLRGRLATLASQLERAQQAPRDSEKLLAMMELAAEAQASASSAASSLEDLRRDLPAAVRSTLATARGSGAAQGGPRAAASRVRLEHALQQAEGAAGRVRESAATALAQLAELERLIDRILVLLRARSSAPFAGAIHALERAAKPAPAKALLEEPALPSHNGHRGAQRTEDYE